MKDNLKILQTLAKLGKIFSKIIMIFSIVATVGCAIGLIALLVSTNNLSSMDSSFYSSIEAETNIPFIAAYAGCIVGLLTCPVEIINCVFAKKYFEYQLEIGTPFNEECANRMKKLGIVCIVTSLITTILTAVINVISLNGTDLINDFEFDFASGLSLGITFIIISIILKSATQQIENQNNII